jgi:hypothetical protein
MGRFVQAGSTKNLGAPGLVSATPCALIGFYVNSTTAGTLVIRNGITASGTALNGTITPAVGWHAFPATCPGGCYASLGGSALDVTFFYVVEAGA